MFGLFRSARVTSPAFRGRTLLRLESLEWRDQPSDFGPLPPGGGNDGWISPPQNQAPRIVDFEAEEITQGLFVVTGRVADESPGGLTVSFGGSTVAMGKTAVTASDGTFSLVVQLPVNGTGAGYLTATVKDLQGLQ